MDVEDIDVTVGKTFFSDRGVAGSSEHSPSVHVSGQTLATDLTSESFTFLFLNIQGYISHEAKLAALIEQSNFPIFLGLNETFLPGEGVVKNVDIKGYTKVSRLDRRDLSAWGGILLYAKKGYEEHIVHVGDSMNAERSWHILHTDRGLVSVILWYRPPNPELDTIMSLPAELEKFAPDVCGHVLIGDINVHEQSWLRFSDGTSPEGRELYHFCRERGWDERVRAPTRNKNLLDLVLTDLGSLVTARVTPGISDHEAILCTMNFPVPTAEAKSREVFDFSKAQWKEMCDYLAATDWTIIIRHDDVDGSVVRFTELLLETASMFIPKILVTDGSHSHPWLDDRCRQAILRKRLARGTPEFLSLRDSCSRILMESYEKYVQKTRRKLKSMGGSSRGWWKVSKSLMQAASSRDPIPPLLRGDGTWAKSPKEKADLFANVFSNKATLDDEEVNEFSAVNAFDDVTMGDGFLPIRLRYARAVLKGLKENSGTGPDLLAAKILRRCHSVLCLTVTLLARAMVATESWPEFWRQHWVQPLHKKNSRAEPGNYRGIHLTPQLSKVLERIIAKTFLPWVNRNAKFGEHQYAYGTNRSHRDALAVNVFSWLLHLEDGDIVALFCSDVSGAFDRVRRARLMAKLKVSGLHPNIIGFLASWLAERSSVVVVGGEVSDRYALSNSVFQGTVLGPPLWNFFYLDACLAVRVLDFIDVVFADDFNAWKIFSRGTGLIEMLAECEACQQSLHKWGRANSVRFDPSKESFHIIHRKVDFGNEFLLLGVLFDCQLQMGPAIARLSKQAGWRLQAILRPRRFFTQREIVNLYKSLVLSYLESGLVAYYHAAPTVLESIDRIQRRMLREVGLTPLEALERFKLAPLQSRRDMAMLGLLHRISSGEAPQQLCDLFPKAPMAAPRFGPQSRMYRTVRRHDKQFVERQGHTDIFRRSIFGLVSAYNLLPQSIVDVKSVSAFQSRLQRALLHTARQGLDNWESVLSGSVLRRQVEYQALFEF